MNFAHLFYELGRGGDGGGWHAHGISKGSRQGLRLSSPVVGFHDCGRRASVPRPVMSPLRVAAAARVLARAPCVRANFARSGGHAARVTASTRAVVNFVFRDLNLSLTKIVLNLPGSYKETF